MINPHFRKTTNTDPGFRALVQKLDDELAIRDGDDHAFYHAFNSSDSISHVLVGEVDGKAVCCGGFKQYDAQCVEIKRMYTEPAHRGKGLASRILGELEAWAAEEGYARAILETGVNQPEAIAMYHKLGYQRIPNYGQYEKAYNSVCFSKQI